jgi:predicted PurR-regulated permease PerM
MVNLVKELKIQNILNTFLSLTGNLFIGGMAILFITFFLLYETTTIRKRMLSLIPNAYFEVTISAFNKIEKLFSNYLLGLLVQMFAIFSVASIGLTLVGVNYALTIAFFAAVANLIPYLGPLLGSLFGIFVAISTQLGNLTPQENIFLVVKIAVVFAVVQIMDNLIFQPLIFSKSLRAHPLEIFVVIFAGAALGRLIVGGLLGGVLGMISAIPFYTILRVSGQELYSGYRQYKVFRN